MNKTKIIIGINIIFLILIIMAFLPALRGGNEGYSTKTASVTPVQQQDVVSTEVDQPTDADQAVVEEPSVITMVEDKVAEVVVGAKAAVNEVVSTIESTVVAEPEPEPEPKVTEEPVAPTTEAVTPTVEPTTSAVEGLYSVVDSNKLDASSYAGFKLFRNWCARCHGTYGQGMVGPDLAESLKFISKEQFYDTVENGKTGQIGSMPAWKANVQVMENRDQLYGYLKARSDGAIGVEKPKKQ